MANISRAKLRNTLKKLFYAVPDSTGPQEMWYIAIQILEFLQTMKGSKPVFMLEHDPDQPGWTTEVLRIAQERDLRIVVGRPWDSRIEALENGPFVPARFAELLLNTRNDQLAYYVCRSRKIAEEVNQICQTSEITLSQEARLLNYPECCVRSFYRQGESLSQFFFRKLLAMAEGDEDKAFELAQTEDVLPILNEEERKEYDELLHSNMLPYTAIAACDACATGLPDMPGVILSRKAERFARSVDEKFFATVYRLD